MNIRLLFLFVLLSSRLFSQEVFSGVFHYKATLLSPDSAKVITDWNIKIFTNDTIVRVETETHNLGNQVYIRHTGLNKAYLLLEVNQGKFAIQTDLDKQRKGDTIKNKYTFRKKLFGKRINGLKCKQVVVTPKSTNTSYSCYYTKKYSQKYLEVYPEFKGLAVDYFLPTEDGLVHYQLTRVEKKPLNRDIFGIPSDYKRVSFSDFMQIVSGQ